MNYYNKNDAIEIMNKLGKAHIRFLFVINYKQDISFIQKIENIDENEILFNFKGVTNESKSQQESAIKKIKLESHPIGFSEYKHSFDIVKNNIMSGNSFLTNLTCATPITTNLSLRDVYDISNAKYRLWMKDKFVN